MNSLYVPLRKQKHLRQGVKQGAPHEAGAPKGHKEIGLLCRKGWQGAMNTCSCGSISGCFYKGYFSYKPGKGRFLSKTLICKEWLNNLNFWSFLDMPYRKTHCRNRKLLTADNYQKTQLTSFLWIKREKKNKTMEAGALPSNKPFFFFSGKLGKQGLCHLSQAVRQHFCWTRVL